MERYIILPRRGIRSASGAAYNVLTQFPSVRDGARAMSYAMEMAGPSPVTVVDTLAENGPKLVEMGTEAAARLNAPNSPVRAVREIVYPFPDLPLRPMTAAAPMPGPAVVITCVDQSTNLPVAHAHVVGFTNFAQRVGAEGDTDTNGRVSLPLSGPTIDRLYVYSPAGYWGAFRHNLPMQSVTIPLAPVNLGVVDCLRRYYPATRFVADAGVVVGVIDTGVGPHPNLNVVGGRNTVTGEQGTNWTDGHEHGTHCAGIIGANGTAPTGLRGMAPGVQLRAYRVFGAGSAGASNYAILKAMILAGEEGCDVINLSLGGGPHDFIVEEAVQDARDQGMLVVVAAGNDGRSAVSYPAAYQGATAVSAMGREGTFPAGSLEEGDIQRPPQSVVDPLEFLASFSNVGPKIAVTGLGVGVLSTLPNGQFGPMSGTSMAAPMVTGAAASLLSQNSAILQMGRTSARSAAIEQLLQSNCVRRQFGATFEGYGLPDPSVV